MLRETGRLLTAFVNSLRGWRYLLAAEANMRYLLIMVAVTIGLKLTDLLSMGEMAILLVTICAAIGLEICNTAFEQLLDLHISGYSERVKRIKDMMSGAVFFALLIYAVVLAAFLLS